MKVILIAEDDDDHYLLTQEALESANFSGKILRVRDGVQLMDYLLHQGEYHDVKKFPRPSLILLDLNMPKKDGRWVLNEIKSDSKLKFIPLIVLTTTHSEEDMIYCYQLGANAFIRKPARFQEFVAEMKSFQNFWSDLGD